MRSVRSALGAIALGIGLVALTWSGARGQTMEPPERHADGPTRPITDPKALFWQAVVEHRVPVDHVATIGRFEYEIFLDRTVTPHLAAARLTKPGFDALMEMSDDESTVVMKEQRRLVDEYLGTMRGDAVEGPTAKKAGGLEAPPPSNDLYDCIKYFDKQYRNLGWVIFETWIYVETWGRPRQAAIKMYGDPISAPRDKACQQKVGYWGIGGDEGGHLVASSLGGWGGRANLVPQNKALNRTLYTKMERAAKFCAINNSGFGAQWANLAEYDDTISVGVRPFRFLPNYGQLVEQCPDENWYWLNGPWVPNETPTSQTAFDVNYFVDHMRDFCVRAAQQPNGACSP